MVNINSTLSTIALNANELIQSKERLSDNKKKWRSNYLLYRKHILDLKLQMRQKQKIEKLYYENSNHRKAIVAKKVSRNKHGS